MSVLYAKQIGKVMSSTTITDVIERKKISPQVYGYQKDMETSERDGI